MEENNNTSNSSKENKENKTHTDQQSQTGNDNSSNQGMGDRHSYNKPRTNHNYSREATQDRKSKRPYSHGQSNKRFHAQNTGDAEGKPHNRHQNFTKGEKKSLLQPKNPHSPNHELKKAVEINAKIHQSILNTHSQVKFNPNAKIRITPLGGLGEIGGNMTVLETEKSAIIIDIGMSFPDNSMHHGVDILIPDFSYIEAIKDKIAGVVITHAHEDHIGAVPYFFKKYQFPIYGTPLPLGLIGSKFDEHGLKKCRSLFRPVKKREPIKIGDFEIEWIHITHSIVDSSALAIKTEVGTIFHTGDFKIDHTPIDGFPTDLHRIAHHGENGVLLLLSDSTNSHKSGITPSEASVGPAFDRLFMQSKGRVIMSTFSSNIHRVYQAIQHGIKYNRKIAVIGRSMEKNLEISRELGYIKLPENIFIEAHEVAKYPDEEVLIVTTGSQGETMSALYRMATDEHRHIKIKPSDTIILSAKAIPGNEGSVSNVLNFLNKAGAKVYYQDFSDIHASGHAAQEEQKLMLRLVKPKFFLPVHGEYNHILRHKETAIQCGVSERNILLMEDGDQIEIAPNYLRKVRSVKTGKTYIDNQTSATIANDVVELRHALAETGMLIFNATIDKKTQSFVGKMRIENYGIVSSNEESALYKEISDQMQAWVKVVKMEQNTSVKIVEEQIKSVLKKLLFKKTKHYPLVIAHISFKGEAHDSSS